MAAIVKQMTSQAATILDFNFSDFDQTCVFVLQNDEKTAFTDWNPQYS